MFHECIVTVKNLEIVEKEKKVKISKKCLLGFKSPYRL